MQSPDYYEFFNQAKIIAGNKGMDNIPLELDGFNAQKPLVLMNKRKTSSCLKRKFINALGDSNMTVGAIFDDVADKAGIGQINDLVGLFRARGCDSMVAIGGGGVVDVAKGVNMIVSLGVKDIFQFAGENKIPDHLNPLVIVPTSYATGYEMTNKALIDNKRFISDFLSPDVIVVDNSMVKFRNNQEATYLSLISLVQAVESYLEAAHNPVVTSYAYVALQAIKDNFTKAIAKPNNKKVSLALVNGMVSGQISFANSSPGIVFALGEALSFITGHEIGLSLGVILPYALDYKLKNKSNFSSEIWLGLSDFDEYATTPESEKIDKAILFIKGLLSGAGALIPKSLKELSISKNKLEDIASLAVENTNNKVNLADCQKILESAWQGEPI
jgi:alcohol dehydrogenase